MVDELSLLEAGSIEEVSALEPASSSLPAPDFTGSLDYIDSLASRKSLTLSRRDLSGITAALSNFDYLSPLLDSKAASSPTDVGFNVSTDFRSLGDARRFNPEFSDKPQALIRSSARVMSGRVSPRSHFPPGWKNPLDPTRDVDDLNRSLRSIERRISRHPFAFKRPNQVVICLKRKLRRSVMASLGFPAMTPFRVPRRSYWSKVVC